MMPALDKPIIYMMNKRHKVILGFRANMQLNLLLL
jgi:hypothetical protein